MEEIQTKVRSIFDERLKGLKEAVSLDYKLSESRLDAFIDSGWEVLEPKTKLLWNWHHDLICEHLEAVYDGEINRLIINIPPRYTKSIITSVLFPAWCWARDPSLRFMFASYSQSLSTKHSTDRRTIIESEWYQTGWGSAVKLSSDQNVKTEFVNEARGHMVATSMLGTAIGKGGTYIIIDDPHDPKIAESELRRNATIEAFDRTFTTRLDDKKNGKIIIIMQRLHENDLTGHLLRQGGWDHIMVPAIAERKTIVKFPSGRTLVREPGDILHPERDDAKAIEGQRRMGSYSFAGQYQQTPSPSGGGMIQNKWWKFYKEFPKGLEEQILVVDASFKETAKGSFVVIQAWGKCQADRFLLGQFRKRIDFVATIEALRQMSAKWPLARAKLIEERANGAAIISVLRKEISGIIAINPTESKEARLSAVSPQIESGNVYLPDPSIAEWVNEYMEEFDQFPNGINDDQVDCTAYALRRFEENDKMGGGLYWRHDPN